MTITDQDRADAVETIRDLLPKYAAEIALLVALEQHRPLWDQSLNLGYYRTFVECSCGTGIWYGEHEGDPAWNDRWALHLATDGRSTWRPSSAQHRAIPNRTETSMPERALTLRLDEPTYQSLRRQAYEQERSITDIVRAAIAQRTGTRGPDEPLTARPNPPIPADADLDLMAGDAIAAHWGGDGIAIANAHPQEVAAVGNRAIWRNGCDAGMVAPSSSNITNPKES